MKQEEKERLAIVEVQIEKMQEEVKIIHKKIDRIQKTINGRLPLWATFTLSGLSALATGLIISGFR